MEDPEPLRLAARDAYGQGRLETATQAQAAALSLAQDQAEPDDFLFLGLLHHAAGRIADGLAVLRAGIARYPHDAAVRENLAVLLLAANQPSAAIEACRKALALGADSPNLHDGLCAAFQRIGDLPSAVAAGRTALEAKDRRFGVGPRLGRIPAGPPPPFNPANRSENVIAYSLWGNAPRYHRPLLENARMLPHLFPAWTLRVYHDDSVNPAYLAALAEHGVTLAPTRLPANVPAPRALLWRFRVAADPSVRRFLVRDADSLLTVKERVAVDAWLDSGRHFHVMRDWYTHTDLMLAGMWGGVGGILPDPDALLRAYTGWRAEGAHIDQDLLTETVWPTVRDSSLIHDSIFQPCLGSVAFPPFGALPAGRHIGQNAFGHD